MVGMSYGGVRLRAVLYRRALARVPSVRRNVGRIDAGDW